MVDKTSPSRQAKALRGALITTGGICILLAFLADQLGFGQPGSFGVGQMLLMLLGIVGLGIGWLGIHRFINLYRVAAIILLNTIVLFICVELASIVISRIGLFPTYRLRVLASYPTLPYYAAQDWTNAYWREAPRAESYRYEPHVLWRHRAFKGETINIDSSGIRRTPGAVCRDQGYQIFTFGGSTMWGWGSPDWGTISAYLQEGFEARQDEPVCVRNYGEDAYVSTQSLVGLIRQLQRGNIPDRVIFFDGVNDVYAAYETGEAGVHLNLADIVSKLEAKRHPLVEWFKGTRQFSLLTRLIDKGRDPSPKPISNSVDSSYTRALATSISAVYLNNYRTVSALAQDYGFDVFFFWQPHLAVVEKMLTDDEQIIQAKLDPALIALSKETYRHIALADSAAATMWYIADLFDTTEQQIFIDEWGHVTPEGNRLIAEKMLALIDNQ